MIERDVFRYDKFLGAMPSGAIDKHNRLNIGIELISNVLQKLIHYSSVHTVIDERIFVTCLWLDSTNEVGAFKNAHAL